MTMEALSTPMPIPHLLVYTFGGDMKSNGTIFALKLSKVEVSDVRIISDKPVEYLESLFHGFFNPIQLHPAIDRGFAYIGTNVISDEFSIFGMYSRNNICGFWIIGETQSTKLLIDQFKSRI